ncbi:hypothetical protein HNY73_001530 [Argiope bruennichi]|uniref:Uncharacterized protein n=1 Tax=Argiope bruennichi TaxID=94029 RepID=A0A8T0G3Z9_ARGBR|nr:hypothetical protein HNY73_001530 [Argiope bruennichi]
MSDGRAADRLIILASSISERLVTAQDGPEDAGSIVDHRKQTQPRASAEEERMLRAAAINRAEERNSVKKESEREREIRHLLALLNPSLPVLCELHYG